MDNKWREYTWLEWESHGSSSLLENDVPDHYVQVVDGRIMSLPDDDDDGDDDPRPQPVGFFRLKFVNVGAARNNDVDIFEVFDSDGETCEAFEALYDPDTMDVKDEVMDILEDITAIEDFLLIQRLGILPEYRGHRLGLLVLRRIIERFSADVGLIALLPLPFEFTKLNQEDEIRRDDEQGIAALRAYYKRLGFQDVPGTPFMVFCPAHEPPPVSKLLWD